MKVRCLNCGLVLGKCLSLKCICPACSSSNWGICVEPEEKVDKESLEMIEDLIRMRDIAKKWVENWENLKKQEDLMRDPFKAQREAIEKQMDTLDPFHYRKKRKEEGLAFEIIDIKDGNKVRVRKIYLNGHIEGFEGNPLVTNHIAPKIMALKAVLKQMNKDYRDFIEKNLLADLPIESVTLTKLYQAQLERIMNIKI